MKPTTKSWKETIREAMLRPFEFVPEISSKENVISVERIENIVRLTLDGKNESAPVEFANELGELVSAYYGNSGTKVVRFVTGKEAEDGTISYCLSMKLGTAYFLLHDGQVINAVTLVGNPAAAA